jgi:hypothetical protein
MIVFIKGGWTIFSANFFAPFPAFLRRAAIPFHMVSKQTNVKILEEFRRYLHELPPLYIQIGPGQIVPSHIGPYVYYVI